LRISTVASAHSNLPHDPDRARRHRDRFAGKFIVGHIAAFDFAHKGQTFLIEAAQRIERLHPEIHFLLLGAGRDEAALRVLAAQRRNVTIEGWTDHVGDYLAAFDVFAFPSIREGLGSILLDAMQFGLPIVASRAGGIPDLVEDERNGLLVPAQDAVALTRAISRLFSDPALRNAMAQTNKLTAHEYGPAIMAERYLKIYSDVAPPGAHLRGAS
jgi:glycosyltransferase involved in cell wall biosynthesis